MDSAQKRINSLPKSPGVYQFFNKEGKIIYIGKANNLKSRVSSYFNKSKYESFKTKVLSQQVFEIKHIVVENETDALLLENNLIKKFQPKYNILLKDDKSFPWICIKNEKFPRIFSTRKLIKDGSVYFGPYTSSLMVKTLLVLVRQLYQLRTCTFNLIPDNISRNKFKRCLEYHIGNCLAPCEGLQSESDYLGSIELIKQILKGDIQQVIFHLNKLMKEYAAKYKFEEAEKVKQKISLLEKYKNKSTIVNPKLNNIDVFSFIEKDKHAFVNFIKVIGGAIVQSHAVELVKKFDETREELLRFAILDIREKVNSNSKEIIVPFIPAEGIPNTNFIVPKRGDKMKLLELSLRNAKQMMIQRQNLSELKPFDKKNRNLLEVVQKDLNLKELPEHIECFDNSNIQGTNAVAACVVFKNLKPSKSDYRHYNIKTVEGPDDYASMHETVLRRYKRMIEEKKSLPQLIVVDGGKGQLNAAVQALLELKIYNKIAIIGIAKRLEEIYYPKDPIPIYIDKKSQTLRLIQNLRNEAHRFGITFHRKKRSASMIRSKLFEIEGIGEKKAEKLLSEFGSVENIASQDISVLKKYIGIKLAEKVLKSLK